MKLRQTLEKPTNGYWDGGMKQCFEWEVESYGGGKDAKGVFVRIGCWAANHFFHVSQGKTEKATLSNAMRHLKASTRIASTFEYVE